ncbi:hypothetical protein [Devosia sp. LjRoot3]|uniref:hypothetical protein n=1 Tax=Devosia sp. LjRoot3 TaxID=3342319 RepID=UPI003ECE79CC
MHNTIIYLIGHYGVGKLTVARRIAATTGARLFDNHLANNVIFSLIREDGRTKIPDGAWDLIMTIRRQALTAMAEIASADASFVLTNALMEDDPLDRLIYDEVVATSARRGSVFVPVFLSASAAAHAVRIPSAEREERLKMTDAAGAAHVRKMRPLLAVDHPHRIDLETTDLPPEEVARRIVAHAEHCAQQIATSEAVS